MVYKLLSGEPDMVNQIRGLFGLSRNPFRSYRTEYKREELFKGQGLVTPKEIAIDTRLDGGPAGLRTVNATIQYIPILETLKQLYSKREFRDSITDNK